MISTAEIRKLLPHRYPMLLVDRVLELVPGERVTAIKAVTCNEPWYERLGENLTDDQMAYPEVLLVESWGQSAGILAACEQPNPDVMAGQVMLVGAMSGVTFHRPVYPGDVVEHRVRVFKALSDTVIFDGESLVDGEVVVTLSQMVMAFRPADRLNPAAEPQPAAS